MQTRALVIEVPLWLIVILFWIGLSLSFSLCYLLPKAASHGNRPMLFFLGISLMLAGIAFPVARHVRAGKAFSLSMSPFTRITPWSSPAPTVTSGTLPIRGRSSRKRGSAWHLEIRRRFLRCCSSWELRRLSHLHSGSGPCHGAWRGVPGIQESDEQAHPVRFLICSGSTFAVRRARFSEVFVTGIPIK